MFRLAVLGLWGVTILALDLLSLSRAMNIELTDLRYFFHVATKRSFAQGAKAAHVSGPAMSKAIKRLEASVGVQLFHRTSRRVELTDAGEIVLRRCREVLGTVEALAADLGTPSGELRGELRIGTMELFTASALPGALCQLAEDHPDLVFKTYLMGPHEMERNLLEGTIDVGLCVGSKMVTHAHAVPLLDSPAMVVCGRGHPLYEKGAITVEDLAEHPFVVPRFFARQYITAVDGFPDELYKRRIGATVELSQMAIEMVSAGRYLGYFSQVGIRCALNHGELRELKGLDTGPPFSLCALVAHADAQKASVQALLGELRRTLAEAQATDCGV